MQLRKPKKKSAVKTQEKTATKTATKTKKAAKETTKKSAKKGATERRLRAWVVRPYEDVVRTFEELERGRMSKKDKRTPLRQGRSGDFEYATFAEDGETEDWSAGGAVPWPAVYLTAIELDLERADTIIQTLVALPALTMKGRGTQGHLAYFVKKGSYTLAHLELMAPDDHEDEFAWGLACFAAFKVNEGWALAITSQLADLALLLGIDGLPPMREWKRARNLVIGDW
jgi:hypothetical protein